MATDFNEIYNQFLEQTGGDAKTAAQYTAYNLLTNPKGAISSIKLPPQWYSQQQWYEYTAPDYLSVKGYSGTDPLTKNTAQLFKNQNIKLADLSAWARNPTSLKLLQDTGLSANDYYDQLKDIYYQKQNAEKQFTTQKSTHVYSQYGLPDPTLRYGLVDNPDQNTVAYKPAVDYVANKTKAFYESQRKQGKTAAQADAIAKQYRTQLTSAVEQKLEESALTPFVTAVIQRRKAGK